MTPKEVVTAFFEAFAKQDVQGMRAALAEDVDWIVLGGAKNIPFAGKMKGAETVIQSMAGNTDSVKDLHVKPLWIVSEGDKVVILMNERAANTKTGEPYAVDSVHVYTVKEGKIVKFENYFNPLPILESTFGTVAYIPPEIKSARLVEEKWIFFEGDQYHHYETFTYDYDEQGRKIRGALNNFARGVTYVMTYHYDAEGRGTGEDWVNSADPKDRYALVYRYDEDHNRIAGGKGAGQTSWEFEYEYDSAGKKIKMTNAYANKNTWEFRFHYDQNGRCVLGEGQASTGLRCLITYQYS